jgi:hypothetical protein
MTTQSVEVRLKGRDGQDHLFSYEEAVSPHGFVIRDATYS